MDRDIKRTGGLQPEAAGFEKAVAEHVRDMSAAAQQRLGIPTEKVYSEDVLAKFGEVVRMSAAAARLVHLPVAEIGTAGQTVVVLNESANTSTITIVAHGGDTINGAGTATIATARGSAILKVVGKGLWATIGGGSSSGAGMLPQLVFADDTEFTEAGGAFVTKKQFRIVKDALHAPTTWRVVASIWIVGGGGDTVECKVDIGGDSVTLTSTSISEALLKGDITIVAASDALLTGVVQVKVTGAGGDTAHLRYTDIYGVA